MTEAAPRATVAVVGAGPAGLMAAEVAARGGADVTVYDHMPSPGRKLLLAGRGGLNLTHSEEASRFLARYGAARDSLRGPIGRFGPSVLRDWCGELGLETFVGTSGRVFPSSFKTSPLLRAWLRRLDDEGVRFAPRHGWRGWDAAHRLVFDTPQGQHVAKVDATVLALGGASWPHLGSDGAWVAPLRDVGVEVAALMPANCGFTVAWSTIFRDRYEGAPLKNVALSFAGEIARSDVTVTRAGLEGSAVYALAPLLRAVIAAEGTALLHVALRPDLSHEGLVARLRARTKKQSFSNWLRKALRLSPVAIGLAREALLADGRSPAALDPDKLARLVNAVPVRLSAPMPIARAISTAGGVRFDAVNPDLMLHACPGVFVAGEMLDWEAPTGGYLLQACFATGVAAGEGALGWIQGLAKVGADAANRTVI